jgi:hypothetical protein
LRECGRRGFERIFNRLGKRGLFWSQPVWYERLTSNSVENNRLIYVSISGAKSLVTRRGFPLAGALVTASNFSP